ncbi:MAG: type I secretion system permease/ATPase [Pseudomonadota bacterium]
MTHEPGASRSGKPFLSKAAPAFVLTLGFSVLLNLLVLTSPLYMMEVFDRVLSTRNLDTLLYLTLIALFAIAVYGVLDGVRLSILTGIAQWWEQRARPLLFSTVLAQVRSGNNESVGTFQDVSTVRQFLASPSVAPLFDAPWVPAFLAVIYLLHPYLGLFAIGAALALLTLAFINEIVTRKALRESSRMGSALSTETQQFLRGADLIEAMGMRRTLADRQLSAHASQLDTFGRAAHRGGMVSGMSKAVRFGVQVGILGLGAYLVVLGELTAGGMIAASIILGRALAPAEQLIGAWKTFVSAREAYGRVRGVLRAADTAHDRTLLPAPKGDLFIDNVSYIPTGGTHPIVNEVSMGVAPGTAVALVGPSGSGKSTLCRMIVGAIPPNSGKIRIDGAEIDAWHPEQLGRDIGYVPQGFELFQGTVRQNISRFTEATDKAVVEAAKLAGCHDMVLSLGQSYDSQVGDGGRFLSGGQRQRVALARALFGEPKLIVLDEANAFLDVDGEAALLRAIAAMRDKGCAVILVTHRPSLLGPIDKVAIMRDGKLTRYGPRDEILRELNVVRPTDAKPADAKPAHGKPDAANVPAARSGEAGS